MTVWDHNGWWVPSDINQPDYDRQRLISPKKKKKKAASPAPTTQPGPQMVLRSEGMLFRFGPIKGITPTSVIDHRIWLPAVLNTFTVAEDKLHNEYDTLSAGQFSQAATGGQNAPRLRTSSVDSILVDWDPSWIVASGQDPSQLRSSLYKILRSGKPVHLLATFHPHPPPHPEFDGHVTIRSISKDVRSGENESRYLTLAISEWRDPSVKRRRHNPKDDVSRKHGVVLPTTHRLTADDTLSNLSYEYYGRYDRWRNIRDANKMPKKIGAKDLIVRLGGKWKIGAKIKIPNIGSPWQNAGGIPVDRVQGSSLVRG